MFTSQCLSVAALALVLVGCDVKVPLDSAANQDFQWKTESFADVKIIRYQVPGWDSLTPKQKEFAYYLTQAGLSGRDIMWDLNYRHNLEIRYTFEDIYTRYKGDRSSKDFQAFELYLKRMWFSNGIHHHYSGIKFEPGFTAQALESWLAELGLTLSAEAREAIFNPNVDAKKVSLDPNKDLISSSAVNFYAKGLTDAEVTAYYASIRDTSAKPVETGLNTYVYKGADGRLAEESYKVGGRYGKALEKVVYWLEKAVAVAENEQQAKAIRSLIAFYKTGDLKMWTDYNINWVQATEGDIDFINGFIEVYNDPKGYKGSFESIVQIKDFEASKRMKVLQDHAQWFEDESTILPEHKKDSVVGITYNVVNVVSEAGDASPVTPIGVNLPNANWIREDYGSKSVSLGNIVQAYDMAAGKGFLEEFCLTQEEVARAQEHGALAAKLHTAMHEVIGHASGRINEGVGTPKETLRNYASAIEEGRADLVALYFTLDTNLVTWGLMPSLEVGKAAYDNYIRNGMLTQLRRLKLGETIEEAHMRNRALVARWAFEKGQAENVIERLTKNGKTFYRINDYQKLRALFGQLLRELQRITSEGDFYAAQALIEGYGVQVDPALHQEVLKRSEALNDAPYGGFINPKLSPVYGSNGQITDVKMVYPADFTKQMLEYSKDYGFLKLQGK